jgi:hypothetical protein
MTQTLRPKTYRSWIQNTRKHLAEQSIQLYSEETTFMIYRADTNAVLATGIKGYEEAKRRANALRSSSNLKWDQVKFKAERRTPQTPSQRGTFGVSGDGRTFTDGHGTRYRVDYARRYNPSKRGRFRGYYDDKGNYHDID